MCELHANGYKFNILNNEFLIHRGYRGKDITSRERWRKDNYKAFRQKYIELSKIFGYSDVSYFKCFI